MAFRPCTTVYGVTGLVVKPKAYVYKTVAQNVLQAKIFLLGMLFFVQCSPLRTNYSHHNQQIGIEFRKVILPCKTSDPLPKFLTHKVNQKLSVLPTHQLRSRPK